MDHIDPSWILTLLLIWGILWKGVVQPIRKEVATIAEGKRDIAEIRKELKPNGGSSLRDAIIRIEANQQSQDRRLSDHIDHHPEP